MAIKAPAYLKWQTAIENVSAPKHTATINKDCERLFLCVERDDIDALRSKGVPADKQFMSNPYSWMFSDHPDSQVCVCVDVCGINTECQEDLWIVKDERKSLKMISYFEHVQGNEYRGVVLL